MDASAIEGSASYNVSHEDTDMVASLNELKRIGVVKCTSSGGGVSGWVVTELSARTLEPVTRLFSPTLALKKFPDVPTSEMSVRTLIAKLENLGWMLREWGTSDGSQPVPVNISTGRPKRFYCNESTANISKCYLQALLSIASITCDAHIEHFRTDQHYRWLVSNGVRPKKRSRGGMDPIMDETDQLAALLDDGPSAKRGRGTRVRGALDSESEFKTKASLTSCHRDT